MRTTHNKLQHVARIPISGWILALALLIAPGWFITTAIAAGKSNSIMTTGKGTSLTLISFSEGIGESGGHKHKKGNRLTVKYKYDRNGSDPLKAEIEANHFDTLKISTAVDPASAPTVYTFDDDLVQNVRTTTKGHETVVTVVFKYAKINIQAPGA